MSNPDSQFALRKSPRLLGMSNPESGSNQFALRRSTRLLGKSSNTKPQRSRIKSRKRSKPCKSGDREYHAYLINYVSNNDIDGFRRRYRKCDAQRFRRFYTIPDNIIMEQKTYICSGGTSSRMDKSSGFTWVAVHGMDSICVVIWDKALDVARLSGFSKSGMQPSIFRLFARTLISEIEDLADSSIESRQTFDQPIKKPFAIVSVTPSTTNVLEESDHEASTAVSNEKTAVKYLEEKMKSDLAFTFSETTQTAIYALQHVVHQKFTANDIWVAVLEHNDIRHVQICEKEEHLVVINEPDAQVAAVRVAHAPRSPMI